MKDLVSEIEEDLRGIGLYEYLNRVLIAQNRILSTEEEDGNMANAHTLKKQGNKLRNLLAEIK